MYCLHQKKKTKDISPEIIASTVELLSKNSIEVSTTTIPDKNLSLPSLDADNAITEYKDFAKLILGEDTLQISDTEYTSEKGIVSFHGNSFEYSAHQQHSKSTINEISSLKKSKTFLSGIGYNTKNAKEDIKKTDNGYKITYTNNIHGVPVFNSDITIKISGDDISYAQGSWFNITETSNPVKLKSITSVLIDIINSNLDKPTKITNISVGYSLPESDSFQKSAVIIPVWKIEFDNNSPLLIDARNPL